MKRKFSFLTAGLTGIFIIILSGCTTSETGRIQYGLIGSSLSPSQEAELGFGAFEQMKKEMPISKNPDYNALVTKVGQRIADQAKSKLPDAKWEFVVFESKEANAFCLPGGKIGVYTGILPITQNEEGLATVLGHEVAHASNHHGAERMGEVAALQKAAGTVSGMASENYQTATALFLGYGAKGVELAFSRTHESEADHVGLLYMARAGYNPEEAVKFWERFAAASKGQPEGYKLLRTHPLTADRIADIKKLLPEAKAAYKPAAK